MFYEPASLTRPLGRSARKEMSMRRGRSSICWCAVGLFGLAAVAAHGAPRDVQFVGVDFETQVVELHNFGGEAQSLDDWQLCTSNAATPAQYSLGLGALTLGPSESIFLHFLGDANGQPSHIDFPGGPVAAPLNRGPYGLAIFAAPVNFRGGATLSIADYLQWNVGGLSDADAGARGGTAELAGLWVSADLWVATENNSEALQLEIDAGGLLLHGPSDYEVLPEPGVALASVCCVATLAGLRSWKRQRAR